MPDDQPALPATIPAFTPVPRKKLRANGWTASRQHEFIEALADTGSVKSAARRVGLTPESAYYLRRQPGAGEFAKAWEAAIDMGVRRIEDIAMDRAINGVQEPVFAYGELVGYKTVYNDQLLMFALRNRLPGKYAQAGQARALNGADKQMLARLKKQWRKEWEAERHALALESRKKEAGALEVKLETMHRRWFGALSPATQRAYALFRAMERRDRERDWSGAESGLERTTPQALLAEVEWLYEVLCNDRALARARQAKIWRLIEAEAEAWTPEPDEVVEAEDIPKAPHPDEAEHVTPRPSPEELKLLPHMRKREPKDDGWEVVEPNEGDDNGGA